MKGKKIIFLVLAFFLPVAVFIFLKIFGRNEFNVPALHQEGGIEAPPGCAFRYTSPYSLPDSVIEGLNLVTRDSLYVLYFDPALDNAMNRVATEFRWASINIAGPSAFAANTDFRLLKECALLMPSTASVALVDNRNRIRGYYDGADRDEVDRLIVEIEIILKQY